MKVVINKCFGGFSLSHSAMARLRDGGGSQDNWYWSSDVARRDPLLVAVVEDLGDAANGTYAKLRVVEIPDGVDYEIDEYDGMEKVNEKHRSWA